jgi:hypothetical protein
MTTFSLLYSYTYYPSVGIEAAVKDYGGRMMVDM